MTCVQQVLDKDKQPMSGVLLSLSGERQYRSNNVTGETGTLVFTSLVSIAITLSTHSRRVHSMLLSHSGSALVYIMFRVFLTMFSFMSCSECVLALVFRVCSFFSLFVLFSEHSCSCPIQSVVLSYLECVRVHLVFGVYPCHVQNSPDIILCG